MAVAFVLELKGKSLSADTEHVAFLPSGKLIFAPLSWTLHPESYKEEGGVTSAGGAKWSHPV